MRVAVATALSLIASAPAFAVQVRDRRHLAQGMRSLKRVPDVKRAQRTRT